MKDFYMATGRYDMIAICEAPVALDIPVVTGLVRRPIAAGTKTFCVEPAMTREEAVAALALGIEMADRAAGDRCTLAGIGEMGIGNTTVASAVAAALTGMVPARVIGRVGYSPHGSNALGRPGRYGRRVRRWSGATSVWTWLCKRRIGGVTRDTLGTGIEVGECLVLVLFTIR